MALTNRRSCGSGGPNGERISHSISTSKWTKLNRVLIESDGEKIGWNAYSPPQKRGAESDGTSQSSQSQGADSVVQISPSVVLGVKKPSTKIKNISRKTRSHGFTRHPSMEDIKKNFTSILKKKRLKNSEPSSSWDEQESRGAFESVPENSPEDFPDDGFDEDILKASQAFEEQQNSGEILETPKRGAQSVRVSIRRSEFVSNRSDNVELHCANGVSPGTRRMTTRSSTIHANVRPPPGKVIVLDEFDDDDDKFLSQLPMPD